MRLVLNSLVALVFATLLISCSSEHKDASLSVNNSFSVSGGTASEMLLPNGIRALVVSLPAAKQPNLSVSVGVGSAHEPQNLPGLAHFVEHMLFLGNKEYPDSLETNKFISDNDGFRNAYTADFNTNYYLTVNTEALPEAVKRYSRFFVTPLFTASLVEKEKNAVHNEYILKFDPVKLMRAYATVFSGEGSVESFFNFGSNESLKPATAQDARDFYNKYYSARNMTIILTGPQDVETLKELITKNFSDVSGHKVNLPAVPKDKPMVNKIVKMNSPEAIQRMNITFDIKATKNQKVKDALHNIGGIIADESKGSLQSVLQDLGYVPAKEGAVSGAINRNQISVGIQITNLGAQNYEHILALVKGYVNYIKSQPQPIYYLEEANGLAKVTNLTQDFSEITPNEIASMNDKYNSKEKTAAQIFGDERMLSYSSADYQTALSLLDLNTVRIFLVTNDASQPDLYAKLFSKTVFKDEQKLQIETVDGVQYIVDGYYKFASRLEDIKNSDIKEVISSDFSLPKENPYIPTHFEMKSKEQLTSVQNLSVQNVDVFYNPDNKAILPKTETSIYLFSPNVDFTDKKQLVQVILMKNWLLANMTADLYPMTIASVEQAFNVLAERKALRINITAWNDKSANVSKDYVSLLSFNDNEVAFQKFKQVTLVSLDQKRLSDDAQLSDVMASLYTEWPVLAEYKQIVEGTTLQDLKNIYTSFFSKYYAQAVISGHYNGEEGSAIAMALQSKFPSAPMSKADLDAFKTVSNKKAVNQLIQVTVTEAVSDMATTVDFYHLGTTSKKEELMSKILGNWIGPDFYYELRTQQQLAYDLWAGHSISGNYFGLYMYLKSSSASSDEIETAMNTFLLDWINNRLTQKEQKDIDAFLKKEADLEQKNKEKLDQESATEKFLGFEWKFEGPQESISITMDDLIQFARTKLIDTPTGVIVKIQSNSEKQTQETKTISHPLH